MVEAHLVAGVRTPIGRYGGALASIRPDDLAGLAIRELLARVPSVDPAQIDDVILGCANQAGEDNRNVGRMAALLAGLPDAVPGTTINRLCGSGLDAALMAARTIAAGHADLIVAGGVESMSRAPFVLPKAESAYSRAAEVFDTTIGWRFVNQRLAEQYGTDTMPETGEHVAADFGVSRADQDAFALRSQQRAAAAQESGRLAREIVAVPVPQRRGEPVLVERDEHPRATSLEQLAQLPTPFRAGGTVTAGNASGVNDGAAALLIASAGAVARLGLDPLARIADGAVAGVPPRIMGIGPAPATRKLLSQTGLALDDVDVVELNEAFASQALAVLRELGLPDDAEHVNANGGAIALGHPLGMSGARLALTAAIELRERGAARARHDVRRRRPGHRRAARGAVTAAPALRPPGRGRAAGYAGAVSTRDRLTEEAARLFAERGYHGTSIADLAAALGIRKSSVYSHIGGKEDLLAELALAGADAFHAALDELPGDVPAGERLERALRAHLSVVDRQLDVATVWLQEWRFLTGRALERFLAERRRYEQRIRALMHDAVRSGELRADLDVEQATLAFLSLGNWAYAWMTHETDVDAVAAAFWSLLRDGMAPR